MIPAEFDYHVATSVEEAIGFLQSNPDAKLLAGGHSLVPLMKLRLSSPSALVDISRIPALKGVSANGNVRIGALTTYYQMQTSGDLARLAPIVPEAASVVGDVQVRNRGTIGGSLAHADPAGDLPAVAIALKATVHLQGPSGSRAVAADDFFVDLLTTAMEDGEVLTAVEFAPPAAGSGQAYCKLPNKASHYATVGVAVVLRKQGSACADVSVGITGAGSHAVRAAGVEAALSGQELSAANIGAAAERADDGVDFLGDIHASEDYRREMVKVFTRRALELAASRAS
jgi:carbon-monoxide dehydrogenase medium subunit